MENVLVKNVKLFGNTGNADALSDFKYDAKLGAWISELDGSVMVKGSDVRRPSPGTKKCDVETGEDMKGE